MLIMNEDHLELLRRINIASIRLDGAYERLSKKMGVKANLLWLLYALDDSKPHSQSKICDEWLFPRTTINTIIRECKDKGLITLVAAPGQKREKRICLTAQGKEYARQALKQVYEAEEEALRETMQTCSARFVEDFEAFAAHIKKAFDEHMPD